MFEEKPVEKSKIKTMYEKARRKTKVAEMGGENFGRKNLEIAQHCTSYTLKEVTRP